MGKKQEIFAQNHGLIVWKKKKNHVLSSLYVYLNNNFQNAYICSKNKIYSVKA